MDLSNSGFQIIGEITPSATKTIVVVGVGRGGTSMCSGTLFNLGIFMGENSPPPTFEDLDIYKALENNRWDMIEEIIRKYNDDHKVWGLKLPALNNQLSKLHRLLRNPVYLFIFRDIAAIASRAIVSHRVSQMKALSDAHTNYGHILSFIQNETPSGVLCSYEKALTDKQRFLQEITNLLPPHLSWNKQQLKEVINLIQRSPKEYLQATSFRGEIGYLDIATKTRVAGWATIDGTDTAKLELIVNDTLLFKFKAKDFREDLYAKNIHKTGHCAFDITLSERLKEGDTVKVRFAQSEKELRGSPTTIQ